MLLSLEKMDTLFCPNAPVMPAEMESNHKKSSERQQNMVNFLHDKVVKSKDSHSLSYTISNDFHMHLNLNINIFDVGEHIISCLLFK